jgi:hypothetical protein
MSQHLRDALLEHLMRLMADHMDRGLTHDEALIVSIEEIRQQIRGSREDLATRLINETVRAAHYSRELYGTRLH